MLFIFPVVINEVDEVAFGVEQVDDCLRDLYPRPLHARVGVVGAAYLVDLAVVEEV